ncbi:Lysine-specific permease [Zancudomyces culisetae]|uniref:Lysine-specific permease n=1 Tax=Zancudomyces culisetae TaxID=1213189 RepID=A0A1R1PTD5_ZANCU|nr:Lysine-specific permease [Zancudomyces culisetae]|eukprot:OMH84152.1 Lysine-specific permease [Zancudomyces culisetae]
MDIEEKGTSTGGSTMEKHLNHNTDNPDRRESKLKREMSTRQISMIAVGGTIGTGLFVASGSAFATAGPAGALVSYLLIGLCVFFVMTSLAEISAFMPIPGSFNIYGIRFIDPAFGFAVAYNYWYSWVTTVASDVIAAGIVVKFWLPNVEPILWAALILLLCFLFNVLGGKSFAEFEFWFSLIKVVAIVAFIVIAICVAAGWIGGVKYGFTNWSGENGAFAGGVGGVVKVFLVAGFSFQGTEIIGTTSGESSNPTKDIPTAIRSIFWRILLFYVLTIFLVGLIVPSNTPGLLDGDVDNLAVSPLVIVLRLAKIQPAAHIMNAVILTSVFSAGNSGLYLTTRTLYALALERSAPKLFTRTTKSGTPIFSLILNVFLVCVFVGVSYIGDQVVYLWLVNLTGIAGFIAWLGILATHYRFRKAYIYQGYNIKDLPYRASLYPFGPIFSFLMLAFACIGQGYTSIFGDDGFVVDDFLQAYLGFPIFLALFFFWKFYKRTKFVKLAEMDLETDNYIAQGFVNYSQELKTFGAKLRSMLY